MFKRVIPIFLVLVLTLSGCGLLGPGADDPRLNKAYEQARTALKEAESEGAKDYASEDFKEVKDELENIRQKHQESPSLEIVRQYQQVQIKAHRATIKSLRQQVKERENREEELLSELEKKEERIKKQKEKVSGLEKNVDKKSRQHEQAKNELEKLQDSYSKQEEELNRIRGEKQKLEKEVERYRGVVDNLQKELEEVQQEISSLKSRLNEKTEQLEQLQQENEAIAAEFEEKMKDARVRIEKRGVVVNMKSKILFNMAEARLKEDAKEVLEQAALVLKDYPEREIRVEGHTCDLPVREAFDSNWELSSQRAIGVLKYLVYGHGVDEERIAAVSFADNRPLKPNTSEENRKMNRRVEIKLLPPELPAETKELLD
ncbi:MAG: OmpA family protein [bacterium]